MLVTGVGVPSLPEQFATMKRYSSAFRFGRGGHWNEFNDPSKREMLVFESGKFLILYVMNTSYSSIILFTRKHEPIYAHIYIHAYTERNEERRKQSKKLQLLQSVQTDKRRDSCTRTSNNGVDRASQQRNSNSVRQISSASQNRISAPNQTQMTIQESRVIVRAKSV